MASDGDTVATTERRPGSRLGRFRWVLLARAALAVLFGLAALLWPQRALSSLVILIGCYLVLDGILGLVQALGSGNLLASLLQALASVAAGATALLWSEISGALLFAVLGVWALVQGAGLLYTGRMVRAGGEGGRLFLSVGAALALFGIVALVWRDAGAVALAWLIGMVALAIGVLLALGARRVRPVEEAGDTARQPED
jgi:uncharacterized membrane protein HdeD (DUF308 family)